MVNTEGGYEGLYSSTNFLFLSSFIYYKILPTLVSMFDNNSNGWIIMQLKSITKILVHNFACYHSWFALDVMAAMLEELKQKNLINY
jgi:hypothetical protein